jgi:signal peptidase I
LRVYFGDILTRPIGSDEPFTIQRRPLKHQRAMQMLVYDDHHRPKAFEGMAAWQRWKPREAKSWDEPSPGTFKVSAKATDWANLRYRNLVPDPIQWKDVLAGLPTSEPRASLISDFYSYNCNLSGEHPNPAQDRFQPQWVGDLTLSCTVQAAARTGTLRFELIEGGVSNRCEVDLTTGMATLYHGRDPLGKPVQTTLNDLSPHNVTFYNVDDRLTLEVDSAAPFGDGLAYTNPTDRHPAPTSADLDPVGIAAKGADVTVSGLVVKRDIYYTLNPGASDYADIVPRLGGDHDSGMAEALILLSDPARFADLGNLKERDFEIRPGHFMMMGDNSPRSKDGRQWNTADQLRPDFPEYGWDPNHRESWEVPEALLIGKAFYVYWPHGKPFGPDIRLSRDFRLPFRPYLERMRWIR